MKTKYLIVGAGISGLTFASYCKDDYIIIEKENEVGGYCKTHYKDDYVWDGLHFNVAGAHAMEDYISTHVVRRESYVKEICQ